MEYKIVSDSASDIFDLDGVAHQSVPLKIITDENEYVDDMSLDVDKMITDFVNTRESRSRRVLIWTNGKPRLKTAIMCFV